MKGEEVINAIAALATDAQIFVNTHQKAIYAAVAKFLSGPVYSFPVDEIPRNKKRQEYYSCPQTSFVWFINY
jgi:hypothetical protein